ncbi:MAG: helix-turn-helix transcriptional regulator [Firmicutes bacterium]|jgi:transcriptional regulator with XRE-family HTH domain|nr:helix-turn-helix transcriptional regulator [Bacillota bacterium]MBQ1430017.1 helix-turn-helix transcriptional regulator [Bacillota bacterium]MBQ1630965.1 helix-turn-helix transcriptional regulator [Bacillota bacterium]MBQ1689984.1 helix-turn-helix transcriptional regulator [Bacillota bacterium]MBQ1715296.1 helix-turn-helix transcriptional regulator [Bacillota bacterium]
MTITSSKDFGQAIRDRRNALKYTQAELAAFTGFSVSFLSDLERGKKTAELEKAIIIANTLGLDLELKGRG